MLHLKDTHWDVSGGPVLKNLSCSAGDAGSIPGRVTRIPHAAGHLSPSATITEPTCSGAQVPQLEGPGTATKDPECQLRPDVAEGK